MKEAIPIILLAASVAAAGGHSAKELSRQAGELYLQARYAEAETLYRQALAAWPGPGAAAVRERAVEKAGLGVVLRAQGQYTEAEKMFTEALKDLDPSADGGEVARVRSHLAALYRDAGEPAKAEAAALQAVDAAPESQRRNARLVLASVYAEQGRLADAEPLAAAMLEGADGRQAMAAYTLLTTIAMRRGEYDKAEEAARQALYFARATLPAGHPTRATAWNNLAQARRFQGRYLEAERAYRAAIEIWEAALGPWHPDLAKGLMNFAAFYHERGRETGAEVLYERAAAILEKAFGKDNVRTLVARNQLADVLRAERRYTESDKLGRVTLAALEKRVPAGDARLADALRNRERLLQESVQAKPMRSSSL
jgi:tetratricopeptide (TPR) repeat protein